MEKKVITVKVEGSTATGKSSITWAIIKTLQQFGIDFELEAIDHQSIDHLEHSMEHDITLPQRMNFIGEKTKIVVKEIQTSK